MFPQAPPPNSSKSGSPNSDGNLDLCFYLPLLDPFSLSFFGVPGAGTVRRTSVELWLGGDYVAQIDPRVEGGLFWPVLSHSAAPKLSLCLPTQSGGFGPEAQAWSQLDRPRVGWSPCQVCTVHIVNEPSESRWG